MVNIFEKHRLPILDLDLQAVPWTALNHSILKLLAFRSRRSPHRQGAF